jgi:hypothetical protein
LQEIVDPEADRCDSIRCVRTTLDIAEDVLIAAKALGKREGKSAGQVISELARRGLQNEPGTDAGTEEFFGFRPLPARGVIITTELINKLRDEEGI